MDGLGGKWTVLLGESGRSWVKVDGPKNDCGRSTKMKPQKCVGIKNMKVDSLRLRGLLKRDESGRF